jgi:hypothetical protein
MTRNERAERFTRDVDALLRGETTAPSDDQALLDLARDLMAADFSAETRLDLLRPRLAKPTWKGIIMSPRYRYVRWFVTTAVLLALAAAAILTVPPLRAIAQDILRRIGIYNVTDAPTSYEISQLPIVALNIARGEDEWHPALIEHAKNNVNWPASIEGMPVGFDTLEYGFARFPGDQLSFHGVVYRSSADPARELHLYLTWRTFHEGPLDVQTGGGQVERVNIVGEQGSEEGVWISGFSDEPSLDTQMLIWDADYLNQQDEIMVILKGHDLSKEQMLEIARSVRIRDPLAIPQDLDVTRRLNMTPAQIANELNFPVGVPQYLPAHLSEPRRHFSGDSDYGQMDTFYDGYIQTDDSLRRAHLYIHQFKAKTPAQMPMELALGDTPFEDITVNGYPGIWVSEAAIRSNRKENFLIWEQDGSTFYMTASIVISREEMFRVAESIEYVWPGQPEERSSSQRKLLPAAIVAGQTGFAVAEPEYVPEGYQLVARDSRRGPEVISAITIYEDDRGDALVMHQGEYPDSVTPHDLALGDSRLIDVTVNGSPAIWVADYGTYPDTVVGMLVWEQNGTILRLQSAMLGRDEMIRIAESLKFVGAPNR